MKWETADLKVGGTVLGAAIILAITLVWLSPAIANRTYPIFAKFNRIDGIAERSPVYMRGFEVGRVRSIAPQLESGTMSFLVQLDLYRRLASGDSLRLPAGTRAVLMPPPMIGSASIVLEPPGHAGAPLEPGTVIPGHRDPTVVDQFQTLTKDLAVELSEAITGINTLVDTLTLTASETNRAVVATSQTIETLGTEIIPLVDGIHAQVNTAGLLLDEVLEQTEVLLPAAGASVDSLQTVLADSRRLIADVQRLLTESEPELTSILTNLDSTSLLMNHFMREVSERPWRVLTGVEPPTAGTEPPEVAVPGSDETPERH